MERDRVAAWTAAYERAWRTAGVESLGEVFTADATYLQGPYHEPVVGLDDIARMWNDERDGPDEVFSLATNIVAVDGNTAVVRAEVTYGNPVTQEYRDLWIIRLTDDGRCSRFEEWPFWPDRPITPPRSTS